MVRLRRLLLQLVQLFSNATLTASLACLLVAPQRRSAVALGSGGGLERGVAPPGPRAGRAPEAGVPVDRTTVLVAFKSSYRCSGAQVCRRCEGWVISNRIDDHFVMVP